MCPACYQGAALILAGITSSGGLAGLVLSGLSKKADGKEIAHYSHFGEKEDESITTNCQSGVPRPAATACYFIAEQADQPHPEKPAMCRHGQDYRYGAIPICNGESRTTLESR